jgi:hypothetical protein
MTAKWSEPCSSPNYFAGQRWAWKVWCTRGSGVSTFDYADFSERLLGATTALIVCENTGPDDASYPSTIQRFRARFNVPIIELKRHPSNESRQIVWNALIDHNITHLYNQISGNVRMLKTEKEHSHFEHLKNVSSIVHYVFSGRHHWSGAGDTHAKIAPSIEGEVPVVPYIARPLERSAPDAARQLRERLNIPSNATVFCSYGGETQFSISFVKDAIGKMVRSNSPNVTGMYFLFANHRRFLSKGTPRVIHLPHLKSSQEKHAFVHACDAMLHARADGETFGLAVAEFNMEERPILAYSNSFLPVGDNPAGFAVVLEHVRILKRTPGALIPYFDESSLKMQLLKFNRSNRRSASINAYASFAPEVVMRRFCEIFVWCPRVSGGSSTGAGAAGIDLRHRQVRCRNSYYGFG